ncbi:hypothetical protein NDU88_001988 [Pleurodeles waltl]|uniref:Uncharacterized protein n=1 Tax=Pleurodeles waltl TaxID=8319 RepID=A0AAV7SE74_PLEWA|nr:hypothetical protein NDU88_001988 [Pleurodeles waltl]
MFVFGRPWNLAIRGATGTRSNDSVLPIVGPTLGFGPTPCVYCPSSLGAVNTASTRIRHRCHFRAYGLPSNGEHPAGGQTAPPFIAPIEPRSACGKRFPGIAVSPLRFSPRAAAPSSATVRPGSS